jgi:hypothetical protein
MTKNIILFSNHYRTLNNLQTLRLGANFGGSKITKSQDFSFEIAAFINLVASSFRNEILLELILFSLAFSSASSKAGNEESIPNIHNIKE